MFGFSGEHLLILAGVLLIFGPRRLPELGSSVGKAMRNFREGLNNPTTASTLEARETPQTALPRTAEAASTTAGVEKSAEHVTEHAAAKV